MWAGPNVGRKWANFRFTSCFCIAHLKQFLAFYKLQCFVREAVLLVKHLKFWTNPRAPNERVKNHLPVFELGDDSFEHWQIRLLDALHGDFNILFFYLLCVFSIFSLKTAMRKPSQA